MPKYTVVQANKIEYTRVICSEIHGPCNERDKENS